MNKFTALSLSLLLLLASAGCDGPRGESKSVDEIYAASKEHFQTVQDGLDGSIFEQQVTATLTQLSEALEKLPTSTGATGASTAKSAEQSLSSLVQKAGYTSRASMAELVDQYEAVAKDLSGSTENDGMTARVKLLAARTYTVLASELETTKFPFGRKQ